jgi:hypothetical protein
MPINGMGCLKLPDYTRYTRNGHFQDVEGCSAIEKLGVFHTCIAAVFGYDSAALTD